MFDNTSRATPLSRREMIRRLVSGAGAGMLFAQSVAAHPIHKHLADGELLGAADTHVPPEAWTPKYLNAHQNETLVSLAERIVPNSGKAQVNRFIDLLLSVDTADTRQKFNNSLAAFDGESMRRFGHAFKDIATARQDELLTEFSNGTAAGGHGGFGLRDEDDDETPEESSAGRFAPRDHFENLKIWITGAYYSSEAGLRELGWTGVFFFQDFPGCQHPEGHA